MLGARCMEINKRQEDEDKKTLRPHCILDQDWKGSLFIPARK